MATMRMTFLHNHDCSRSGKQHVTEVPVVEGVFDWPTLHCAERVARPVDRSELIFVKVEETA